MSRAPRNETTSLFHAARSPVFLLIVIASGVAACLILVAGRNPSRTAQELPASQPIQAALVKVASPPKPARANLFECRWTQTPINIDGMATEPAWAEAQPISRFYLPWLKDNARDASTATRARLLWDREYLYFLAEMADADLHAPVAQRDGQLWDDDVFEIFLKPARDKPGYYEFQFNPAGAILDMFLPARDSGGYARHKSDGEFDIKASVQLTGTLNRRDDVDRGWIVEGRIAWTSLLRTGGRPEPGETWMFALCRVDDSAGFQKPELSTTAPLAGVPYADFHRVDEYAPLTFIGPSGGPGAIQALAPLTTSRVVGSPDPPPTHRVVNAYPNLKLPHPIAIDRQPHSDRMLVITEAAPYGSVKIIRFVDDPKTSSYETLLKLDAVAYDLAFHPDFARNGYVYIGLNGPLSATPKKTRVVRYRMDPRPPHALDPKSATTIIEWESDGHNGGAIDFGPDGMLYISSGDGSTDSDTWLSGQDLSRLLAKVLRIDVDHPDAGRNYSVPADNPFVGQRGVRPETWAYGLRNPWRMAFDRKTGQLWLGQNGQDHLEQVYLIEKGANYGWSIQEGSKPFYPDRKRGPHPIRMPTAEHAHSEARSLTGGIVYHEGALPELQGAYIYGDYSTGKIWGIRHDGNKVTWRQEIADTGLRITGFGVNARGELLVLDHVKDGIIHRLEAAPPAPAAGTFPRTLSESGLFKSVQAHAMEDGVLPYSVNAELWSDGAYKERFLAIPAKSGQNGAMTFTGKWGFDFPDETVLVKSFALETEAGNPASRKWIETRFFTRQQGEWVGYSYAWNDQGTDAMLVEAAGRDRDLVIRDSTSPGGTRKQTWRYPSRTECMVCHSRAANFVLGPSLVQLNKDHHYGNGQVENQLALFERLGILRVDYRSDAIDAVRAVGRLRGLANAKLDEYVRKQTTSQGQREAKTSRLLAKNPAALPRLVDPLDSSAGIETRARSYLHANCAMCHVEAGGGNAAMELDYFRTPDRMRTIDAVPLHGTFGLAGAKLIVPGRPERSVLLHRMKTRGGGQMPPLATSLADEAGVELLRRWIEQMDAKTGTPAAPGGRQ